MSQRTLSEQELTQLLTPQSETTATPMTTTDLDLFRLLSSIDSAILAELIDAVTYRRGAVIFEEGAPGDAAYLIWSGQAAVVKGGLDAPTLLGYRGPGEIVGEMALIEDRPRSASIVALSPLRTWRIERENFGRLLELNPAIGMRVMARMSARLREADDVRDRVTHEGRQLVAQVSSLQELQRLRQETIDLIVHDLRNPLGIVRNVLQMLEMTLPEAVQAENRDLLNIGRSASDRMLRLVNALLGAARLEEGAADLNLRPVRLGPLLKGVADQTLRTLVVDIAMNVEVPPNLPPVPADAEQIERVVYNLVDNAVKHTPPGGSIVLAAERSSDAVRVSVTDTGRGIPPAARERIFERFAQVKGDVKARRGYGLGLRFCKLAVEAHGGRIWVEPGQGGRGSCFVFTLPLAPS
jgi:signal transduction histidine kinase